MDLVAAITSPENFFWAWEKVKNLYANESAWFDDLELARFEGTLRRQFEVLKDEMQGGSYRCSPIHPLPHPKGNDRTSLELRQSFSISIRDQLAWLAVINILGPAIDDKMPSWSFGNRLHRPVWAEEESSKQTKTWKFGPYRHTTRRLYRKFQHSWPLYRRYVFLTLKQMSRITARALPSDRFEDSLIKAEEFAPEHRRLPYLRPGFWKDDTSDVYWVSLDFEKFYPNVNLDIVATNLIGSIPTELKSVTLEKLIRRLLSFRLDLAGWLPNDLEALGLRVGAKHFNGLPTGLMVSGFLANIAMLNIDRAVAAEIQERQVAHFRYVDDHIVLGRTFDEIHKWILRYTEILNSEKVGAKLNPEKFEPKAVGDYLSYISTKAHRSLTIARDKREAATKVCKIDPLYPSPLMTATLNKISQLSELEFDLMDDQEKANFLSELEHLMLAEINERELPNATRLSFVATVLTRLVPEWIPRNENLIESQIALYKCREEIVQVTSTLQRFRTDSQEFQKLYAELSAKQESETSLELEYQIAQKEFDETNDNHGKHYRALVLRALHQHPAKLRLWQRTLEYGYATGQPICDAVVEELDNARKQNEQFARYVSAFVFRVVAKLTLRATKEMIENNLVESRQRSLEGFVDGIHSAWRTVIVNQPKYWFERNSIAQLQCALGTEQLLTAEVRKTPRPLVEPGSLESADHDQPINWNRNPREWALLTDSDLSVWAWWIERNLHRTGETAPTQKWDKILQNIDENDTLAWALWTRYPMQLPLTAMQSILSGSHRMVKVGQGWLLDAMRSNSITAPAGNQRPPYVIAQVLRVLKAEKEDLSTKTLSDWIHWSANRSSVSPDDPRLGEWTALELVKRIALRLQTLKDIDKKYLLHPSNIVIPRSWFDTETLESGFGTITWEAWRRSALSGNIRFREKRFLISDGRLTPQWWMSEWGGDDWAHLHGFGMLLLSLLRKSYEFPAEWNPLGHQRAWTSAIRAWINLTPCSSWTSTILESCLLPRVRETFLINAMHKQFALAWDDDSHSDPPMIYNIDIFVKLVSDAQNTLEQGQLTMPRHKPRQLIPISLHTLTTEMWGDDGGAE